MALLRALPNVGAVLDTMAVYYIGPRGQPEQYMHAALGSRFLRVRPLVVLRLLHALRALNPLYRDVVIDESRGAVRAMENMHVALMEASRSMTDERSRRMEAAILSDVAQVRHTSDETNVVVNGEEVVMTMDHSVITSHEGVRMHVNTSASHPHSTPRHETLNTARAALIGALAELRRTRQDRVGAGGVTAPDGSPLSRPDAASAVRITDARAAEPLSDLTQMELQRYLVHPLLFILAEGVPRNGISQGLDRHYMEQFSRTHARDALFCFSRVNQIQRLAMMRGVSLRARSDPASLDRIADMLEDEQFPDLLARAVEDPDGREGEQIFNSFSRFVTLASNRVPHGVARRQSGMTEMLALWHRSAAPPIYVTTALDDVHHTLTVRLSFASTKNSGFPAQFFVMYEEALASGRALLVDADSRMPVEEMATGMEEAGSINIPLDERALQALHSQNPGSASWMFKRIVEVMFAEVFGCPLTYTIKKTTSLADRQPGAFGRVVASYGCVETQQRRSLHAHILVK